MKIGLHVTLSFLLLGCGSNCYAQVGQPPSKLAVTPGAESTTQTIDWTEARAGTAKGTVEAFTGAHS
jgi:hypothetical protein